MPMPIAEPMTPHVISAIAPSVNLCTAPASTTHREHITWNKQFSAYMQKKKTVYLPTCLFCENASQSRTSSPPRTSCTCKWKPGLKLRKSFLFLFLFLFVCLFVFFFDSWFGSISQFRSTPARFLLSFTLNASNIFSLIFIQEFNDSFFSNLTRYQMFKKMNEINITKKYIYNSYIKNITQNYFYQAFQWAINDRLEVLTRHSFHCLNPCTYIYIFDKK